MKKHGMKTLLAGLVTAIGFWSFSAKADDVTISRADYQPKMQGFGGPNHC